MATRTNSRQIPIVLAGAEFKKLEQLAAAEDRDTWQQARRLLREAIAEQHGRRFGGEQRAEGNG